MNQVQIVGRMVRNPELRYTESGRPLCLMTIATDRPFKNHEGERLADFIPVRAWGNVAKAVAEHVKQGRRVAISGSLRTRLVTKQEVTYNEVILNAETVEFLDEPLRKPVKAEEEAPDNETIHDHDSANEETTLKKEA